MCPEELFGVYEDDLIETLKELGLFGAIQKGSLGCIVCQKTITMDNLAAIARRGEETIVCCNAPECLLRFPTLSEEPKE